MVATSRLVEARISEAEKLGGTEGQGIKEWAQRRRSPGGLPEVHLAAHLCATKWLKGGWLLWGGWPLEAFWRAPAAMFVVH